MDRTFPRSTRRRRRALDGSWEFVTDPDDEGVEAGYPDSFPADRADTVPVPCSWTALPEYAEYVGPAWYRRTFGLPETTAVTLRFQGVGHHATVYLDGEEILSHAGGYTPFSTYVRELEAGTHDLVVRADNTPDDASLLHEGTDWFPHGGINREVVLEEVADLWVTDLDVDYELDGDDAVLSAAVTLHNVSPTPTAGTLGVGVGEVAATSDVEVGGLNATTEEFELSVTDVDRWSLEDPVLYDVVATVRAESGTSNDDLRDRIGFREVNVDGRDVLLNGDPVSLRGVEYPENHPDWGHAVPQRIQRADVASLYEAGFNVIRCADYPPHPRLLDRCDEVGMLVIEGITPHGADELVVATERSVADSQSTTAAVLDGPEGVTENNEDTDPETAERHGEVVENLDDATGEARRILTELVQRDDNHPAVVGWHLGTERPGDGPDFAETVGQLGETVRGLDGSRLVLAASAADRESGRSPVFRFSDAICVERCPAGESWTDHLERVAQRYPEEPILVTDFGAPGIPGEHAPPGRSTTESRQAERVVAGVETFRDDGNVAGFSVGQFCDATRREEETRDDAGSPPTPVTEYRGILAGDRRPKDAFVALRERLPEREPR